MKLNAVFIIAMAMAMSACAKRAGPIYYWGGYVATLHAYTQTPTAGSRAAHKAQLFSIIEGANRTNKKVPPGIHFELGMLEMSDGNKSSAIAQFNQEQALFPESAQAVSFALKASESSK